jgi:type III pantothenate kinase
MLLAVDIGNTNIVFGVFDGTSLKATWRIASGVHRMPDEYASNMLHLFEIRGIKAEQITDAVICSVVPPLVTVFEELCQHYFNFNPLVVGAVPLSSLI